MEPPTLRILTLNILKMYMAAYPYTIYNHRIMINRFQRDQKFSQCMYIPDLHHISI